MLKANDIVVMTLSRFHMELAEAVAHSRNDEKERRGVASKRFHTRTDYETHLVGALAEVALSEYLGIGVDRRFLMGGDGGVDFRWWSKTIDIKARQGHSLDAMFYQDWSDLRADIAVLSWVGEESVSLVGYLRSIDAPSLCKEQHDRRGMVRNVVPWARFRPMSGLLAYGRLMEDNESRRKLHDTERT